MASPATIVLFMAVAQDCPNIQMVLQKPDHAIMLEEVTVIPKHQEGCEKRFKENPCLSRVIMVDYRRAAIMCGPKLVKEEKETE